MGKVTSRVFDGADPFIQQATRVGLDVKCALRGDDGEDVGFIFKLDIRNGVNVVEVDETEELIFLQKRLGKLEGW